MMKVIIFASMLFLNPAIDPMFFESNTSSAIRPQFLFNRKEYLLQHNRNSYTAYTSFEGQSLFCQITEVEAGHYISGYRSTFGGIEGFDERRLDEFIQNIINELTSRKASSLIIRQAPECYHTEFAKACHESLIRNKFTILTSDINQNIPVDGLFDDKIDIQEKRRLKKLKESGIVCKLFSKVEGAEWYDLLLQSRKHRNYPVTVSREVYYGFADTFPDVYTYAGVYLNDQIIANAVFVRVSENVMYYFIPASDPDYNKLSPAVLILESMYNTALQQKCSMIDLGISSVDGELNEGLYKFKKHMGALDSKKIIYKYTF